MHADPLSSLLAQWGLGFGTQSPVRCHPGVTRTHCPEARSSRHPRKGWLLPVPPSTCHQHHGPKSSKAPEPPSAQSRGAVSHGGDTIPATAPSQGTSKDRKRRRSQAPAPGDTLAVAQGHPNRSHLAAVHIQRGQGTAVVTLQCPQAGRGRLTHPAALPASGSWERDTARAIHRLSPPAVATGTSHPRAESADATGATVSPAGAQRLPDAGMPPGRAAAARQHRPAPAAPVAVARLSPAVAVPAGTASCHPAAPCFAASASHPRWYRRHKAPLSLRRPRGVMPASVPGPVPPPLTPLPPQGTAPGDTSPRHGVGAQLTPLVSALMTSERRPWRGGPGAAINRCCRC